MGIQVVKSPIHWNYFIALEQDLEKVSRFIEFSEENFGTYSIELAHLLLAASSEVDVVLKALCNLKSPNITHENINQYRETIKKEFPEFIEERCYISRYGLILTPWSNWSADKNPLWWRSHNNVKHQRDTHFREANLHNTINALAGLSLAVLYYYREIFSQDSPCTFKNVTKMLSPSTNLIQFKQEYIHQYLIL